MSNCTAKFHAVIWYFLDYILKRNIDRTSKKRVFHILSSLQIYRLWITVCRSNPDKARFYFRWLILLLSAPLSHHIWKEIIFHFIIKVWLIYINESKLNQLSYTWRSLTWERLARFGWFVLSVRYLKGPNGNRLLSNTCSSVRRLSHRFHSKTVAATVLKFRINKLDGILKS